MSIENPVFIPPVKIDDYEEFRDFAREAALVVYTPEYFRTPFIDDQKRLRRVTLTAIGVNVKGLPMTFKYVLDYEDIRDSSKTWDEQSAEVSRQISSVIEEIGATSSLFRGSVETEPSFGELLARP